MTPASMTYETKYTGTGKPNYRVIVENENGTHVSYTKTFDVANLRVNSAMAHGWQARYERVSK